MKVKISRKRLSETDSFILEYIYEKCSTAKNNLIQEEQVSIEELFEWLVEEEEETPIIEEEEEVFPKVIQWVMDDNQRKSDKYVWKFTLKNRSVYIDKMEVQVRFSPEVDFELEKGKLFIEDNYGRQVGGNYGYMENGNGFDITFRYLDLKPGTYYFTVHSLDVSSDTYLSIFVDEVDINSNPEFEKVFENEKISLTEISQEEETIYEEAISLQQTRVNTREIRVEDTILYDNMEVLLYQWKMNINANDYITLEDITLHLWEKNTLNNIQDVLKSATLNIGGVTKTWKITSNWVSFSDANIDIKWWVNNIEFLVTATLKNGINVQDGTQMHLIVSKRWITAQNSEREHIENVTILSSSTPTNILKFTSDIVLEDNLRVVALWAYEWSYSSGEWHGWTQSSDGTFTHYRDEWKIYAHIENDTDDQVYLVLSSYEPVEWVLSGDTDTFLGIIVSGYHSSRVSGVDGTNITYETYEWQKSSEYFYAYKKGTSGYTKMLNYVEKWLAGNEVDVFWGVYAAQNFHVNVGNNSVSINQETTQEVEEGSFSYAVINNGVYSDYIENTILAGTNNVALAEVIFKAEGEDMDIDNLKFTIPGMFETTLKNVRLMDGSTIISDNSYVYLSGENTIIEFEDFSIQATGRQMNTTLVSDTWVITTQGGIPSAMSGDIVVKALSSKDISVEWADSNQDIVAQTLAGNANSTPVNIVPALVNIMLISTLDDNKNNTEIELFIDYGKNITDSKAKIKSLNFSGDSNIYNIVRIEDDNGNSLAFGRSWTTVNFKEAVLVNDGDRLNFVVDTNKSSILKIKKNGINIDIDEVIITSSNASNINLGEYYPLD